MVQCHILSGKCDVTASGNWMKVGTVHVDEVGWGISSNMYRKIKHFSVLNHREIVNEGGFTGPIMCLNTLKSIHNDQNSMEQWGQFDNGHDAFLLIC